MPQMDEQDARDLLIRIHENTKTFREAFDKHTAEDAARFNEHGKKIDAVHSRMDDIDTLKNRFWGGIAVISVLWGIAVMALEYFKK